MGKCEGTISKSPIRLNQLDVPIVRYRATAIRLRRAAAVSSPRASSVSVGSRCPSGAPGVCMPVGDHRGGRGFRSFPWATVAGGTGRGLDGVPRAFHTRMCDCLAVPHSRTRRYSGRHPSHFTSPITMDDICSDALDTTGHLASILRHRRSKEETKTIVCMLVHQLTWKAMQDSGMSATSTRSCDPHWV